MGDDQSFRSDERFKFLDTATSRNLSQAQFNSESNAILVKSACVDAIACSATGEDGGEFGALLLFQEEIHDQVLIRTSDLDMDVSSELEKLWAGTSREVSCLLLGSSEEEDPETKEPVLYDHMLVLQPSSDMQGAWERMGILNIRHDVGIHASSVKTFKLI